MGTPVYSDECVGGGMVDGVIRGEYHDILIANGAYRDVVGGGHGVDVLKEELW